MVQISINLLERKGAREIILQRLFDRVKRGSFVVIAGYVVVLLVVFGVRLYFGRQKAALNQDLVTAKTALNSYAVTESQQVLVKSKLQTASRVMATQKQWSRLLDDVMEFIPDSRAISQVELIGGNQMKITVQTKLLAELAIMLNALFQIGSERDFVRSVSLDNVEKNTTGSYGFTLVFET